MDSQLPESSSNATAKRGRLLCVLGVWFGIAAAIGNTIAAGIVRTPGDIATWLPNIWCFLGIWVVGGLYAFCGVSSLAELGAAIPLSGGQFNYSRRALGDYAGFLVGWSDWLSNCGTLAAVALVTGEYAAKLVPAFNFNHADKAIALVTLVAFAILQWRGIRWGSAAQMIITALKTAAFLVLVAACFLFGWHQNSVAPVAGPDLTKVPGGIWGLIVPLMLALQAVLFTIDGWDGVIYFGEEVRNPGKDIPKAMFGSLFSVMAIYVLLNAAVVYVLPMSEIAGNKFALGTAAQRIFGVYGDTVVRGIMIVSLLGCINAVQLFCPRIIFAMSRENLFFKKAAEVNRGGTPVFGMLLSTLIAICFVLGSFERVIAMLSFFFVANYTLSYLSLFLLRRREPQMERPYRAWGYPWTTGIALIGSIIFLLGSIATDRDNAPLALGMLVCSYPIFHMFFRKKSVAGN